jgi:hypothetical protein
MALSWLKSRSVKKNLAIYSELLGKGDIHAAIDIYEKKLASFTADIDKSVRTTYHLYRWLIFDRDEDFQSLKVLATGEPMNSIILTAYYSAVQFSLQRKLAAAVKAKSTWNEEIIRNYAGIKMPESLEKLGIAILEVFTANQQILQKLPAYNISSITQKLPLGLPDGPFQVARNQILIWAKFQAKEYEQLYGDIDNLKPVPENIKSIKSQLLFEWLENELNAGNIDVTELIFNELSKFVSPASFSLILLKCGLKTFQKNPDATIKWVSNFLESASVKEDKPLINTLRFFIALIYLSQNKFTNGREIIGEISQSITSQDGTALKYISDKLKKHDILVQFWNLEILSYIADTVQWPFPKNDGENKDSDTSLKNLALWRDLLVKLKILTEKIIDSKSEQQWMGHFLNGLLLFTDNKSLLTAENLNDFSRSLENFQDIKLLEKAKSIEGALQIRLKATDEAIEFIKNKDIKRLRDLYENVLHSIADSIPAYIRASVYLLLWLDDPKFDALNLLTQIPVSPEEESLIADCIKQIQVTQAIQRFNLECSSLEPLKQNLPNLNIFSFDNSIFFYASVASTIIYIKNNKFSEAHTAISNAIQYSDDQNKEISDYLN